MAGPTHTLKYHPSKKRRGVLSQWYPEWGVRVAGDPKRSDPDPEEDAAATPAPLRFAGREILYSLLCAGAATHEFLDTFRLSQLRPCARMAGRITSKFHGSEHRICQNQEVTSPGVCFPGGVEVEEMLRCAASLLLLFREVPGR